MLDDAGFAAPGTFGGYGLFLSPSFNWWGKADLFRNLGLGFLAVGLLRFWRGRSDNWLRQGMTMNARIGDRRHE